MEESQHSDFPALNEWARKSALHLLRVESALLILLALYLCVRALINLNEVTAPGALIGEIAFSLTSSVGLYLCSGGFARKAAYGRAPALLANLIALGVAYFMISGHLIWVGIALAFLASVTAISALLGYTE